VIRVVVKNGKPDHLEPFITGWKSAEGRPWGRPVGIAIGPNGTMYISDDAGGRIYSVRWGGGGTAAEE